MSKNRFLPFILLIGHASCFYLHSELKPKDYKLNKAVWVKNGFKSTFYDEPARNDFIFSPNSMSTDDLVGRTFFQEDLVQGSPYMSIFDRNKRELAKKNCDNGKCSNEAYDEKTNIIDDYKDANNLKIDFENTGLAKEDFEVLPLKSVSKFVEEYTVKPVTATVKRTGQNDFDKQVVDKLEMAKVNKSGKVDIAKMNRKIFDREESFWPKISVLPGIAPYSKYDDSNEDNKSKNTGFVKLMAALSKALKKTMIQQELVRKVEQNMKLKESNIEKKILEANEKLHKFNELYKSVVDLKKIDANHEDCHEMKTLKDIEVKLRDDRENFNLLQQRFLEQNEQINRKQASITFIQQKIATKQALIAKLLKNNTNQDTAEETITPKPVIKKKKDNTEYTTTENVKIDLFDVPVTANNHKNVDQDLLNEKDSSDIDDLVYKYYFNNTFVDNFIKEKVLSTIMTDDKTNFNKRNIVPNEDLSFNLGGNSLDREKRWLGQSDDKPLKKQKLTSKDYEKILGINEVKDSKDFRKSKDDPYVTMAKKFCKEISPNMNRQELMWCIEKALRKLQMMDVTKTTSVQNQTPENKTQETSVTELQSNNTESTTESRVAIQTDYPQIFKTNDSPVFFPDNEELEMKLKEYDLKPDVEGNVYYDGSLHASDLALHSDGGESDIIPGIDSNSHVEVEPLALEIQSKRRAYVRHFNDNIMKKISRGELKAR